MLVKCNVILYALRMDYHLLTKKKQVWSSLQPLPKELTQNLNHWVDLELTYTSNSIEGNTLTRRETAEVIDKGLTVGGKSLREHLEAVNHSRALEYVRALADKETHGLSERHILEIHGLILKGIDDSQAGRYRTVPVRIGGSQVILPNPRKVPELMTEFMRMLKAKEKLHPVQVAGEAHYQLVTIHPFADGNGRTARLLMNLLLLMRGYPMAVIRKQERLIYLNALEKAQLGGSRDDFDRIVFRAVDRSLDFHMESARGESSRKMEDEEKMLKIGELAQAVHETVSTVRHWIHAGLVQISDETPSGYQLFAVDMIERCKQIQKLKTERLSLKEIKDQLDEK